MKLNEKSRMIDTKKARGEMEEDLLESIYRLWRQDAKISTKEYARENGVTGKEAASLVRGLVKKGFLCEPEKNGLLELTEKGKLAGMNCLARHEKLTQFFQLIGGMEQENAQQDACRIEHYISPEGLRGIENFLQYGDVYDRVYDEMDIYSFYEEGSFKMAYGLYEPERRNPRFLAEEYDQFESSIILEVDKDRNSFLLYLKESGKIGYFWYRRRAEWICVELENGAYRLPTDIFRYTVNTTIPITEATAIVAITRFKQEPIAFDCRELNIHIW